MIDGGLRKLFRQRLPGDWQSIEAESIGRGVPDANYCINGFEGWVEFKQTTGWTVDLRPEQVAWMQRRARNGGKVTIAVRQKAKESIRREARDVLWLFKGSEAAIWKENGLEPIPELYPAKPLLVHSGGPSLWDWDRIASCLCRMDK